MHRSQAGRPLVVWDVDLVPNTSFDLWTRRTFGALRGDPAFGFEAWPGWKPPLPLLGHSTQLARLCALMRRHAALPMLLHQRHARILHAPTVVAPLWGSAKLVVTIYDLILLTLPAGGPSPWIRYYRWLLPRVLQRAAAIVAISESTRAEILALDGRLADKVQVVYPGVDHRCFRPQPAGATEAVLRRYGIDRRFIIYVGQLAARKNPTLLLRSIALLKERGTWGNRQVVVAGPDRPGTPTHEAFRAAVVNYRLESDVVLTGFVPEGSLAALYAAADALVHPSGYEGFGMTLVEAMACGTPVVGLEGSAVSEVVGSGGVLVGRAEPGPYADGIERILAASHDVEVFRHAAVARAAAFDWHASAGRIVDIYRSLV